MIVMLTKGLASFSCSLCRCWNKTAASCLIFLVMTSTSLRTTTISNNNLRQSIVVDAFAIPDSVVHFSVGATAGCFGAIAAYPFDYIKSQMQTETGSKMYNNGWDAFRCTIRENPFHLYRGIGVQVLGIAPEKGIKLGLYDILQTKFVSSMGIFPLWAQIFSGCVAGACQVLATCPLEVMKVGLQTSDMRFREVWQEVGGFEGLYRGADACIMRDVVHTAVCFPLYAALVGSMNSFVAGGLAGMIATGVATPPDVIKTRMLSQEKWTRHQQQQEQEKQHIVIGKDIINDDSNNNTNRNAFVVARQTVRFEGITVLFSGLKERCIGAIPRFGTTLALHDFLENYMANAGWLSK